MWVSCASTSEQQIDQPRGITGLVIECDEEMRLHIHDIVRNPSSSMLDQLAPESGGFD